MKRGATFRMGWTAGADPEGRAVTSTLQRFGPTTWNAGTAYGAATETGDLTITTEGRYRFRTIVPALYPGRARHYHIKVQAAERPVLTTQLYFPDDPSNRRDGLFRRELAMRMSEAGDGFAARFDFVLDLR